MRALHHSLLLAAAWLCVLPASAETLLVVRKTDNAVDFMDPGSGLRLASVLTGNAPHEISVSPDGKRAVVSNYGTREHPGSTLSIVDLEQPQEVLLHELARHSIEPAKWLVHQQHARLVDQRTRKLRAALHAA